MTKGTAAILLVAWPCLAGCFSLESSKIADQPLAISKTYRTPPANPAPPEAKNGSIWRGGLTTMFSDQRARGVGDIITVNIAEVSQASEAATTDTTRKSQTVAGLSNFFGLENHAIGPWKNSATLINANAPNNDFSGAGATTRTGSLSATITARVMEVMPNGNFVIEGKRELRINNEKKEILLQGIVRPRDIAFNNTISSTQIADAKVIFTGIGVVAEKQRPGWAARLFDFVWPF
ncbi:MAG: flagellar basal body L-ring protein FlgH [Syntrophorhabdales bacterium]